MFKLKLTLWCLAACLPFLVATAANAACDADCTRQCNVNSKGDAALAKKCIGYYGGLSADQAQAASADYYRLHPEQAPNKKKPKN